MYTTYLDIKKDYLNGRISFEDAVKSFFDYASHRDSRALNIKQLRLWHKLKTGLMPSIKDVEKYI